MLITQPNRETRLYRNDQNTGHHWLRVILEGDSDNKNAIGAIVELTAAGVTQRRLVTSGRSFLSQIELPLTFGLGLANKVDSLLITWPNGQQQSVTIDQVDQQITIKQSTT